MVKVFGPLVELARLQNEINKIFETLLDLSPEESLKVASGWVPSVDVRHTETTLTLMAELPGVEPGRIRLAVSSGQVTIRGEKAATPSMKGARYHCLERSHGPFSRTIHLPVPVNTHRAQATLREGLLTLSFPRVPNRRGQAIEISIETE